MFNAHTPIVVMCQLSAQAVAHINTRKFNNHPSIEDTRLGLIELLYIHEYFIRRSEYT